MSALGDEFRTAREARGLSLSDVAEHIHIRSVYLAAIEAEDWSSIGAPVYVRGFIRTYARFLGLDAEAAIARFAERLPSETAPAAPVLGKSAAAGQSGPSPWAIGAIALAVLLVAFVSYEYWLYQSGAAAGPASRVATAPTAAATARALQPAPVATGSVAPAGPTPSPSGSPVPKNQLALRLTERSWLRVTVDGAVTMEGVFPSGTIRSFTGKSAVVRAGNAGGVDISLGGRSLGAMGSSGDVAERTFSLGGE